MNERIKELVTLALEHADHYDKIGVDHSFQNIFNEKFAELIVRECALTAGLMEHEGRQGIGAQILDNFGVEE